jgi:hypothetical protein
LKEGLGAWWQAGFGTQVFQAALFVLDVFLEVNSKAASVCQEFVGIGEFGSGLNSFDKLALLLVP